MLANIFCHNLLTNALEWMHTKTRTSLINHVKSLLSGRATLSFGSIGRNLPGDALAKHKINMSWRFSCNKTIQNEQVSIYKSLSHSFMEGINELILVVDWTGCCGKKLHMLRASLVYDGRAIPIYNEIYPQQALNSDHAHKRFLKKLQEVLPCNKKVVIITDAGFKTPWFSAVAELGWYFIGRVSGLMHYKLDSEKRWKPHQDLSKCLQRGETKYIGKGKIGRNSKTKLEVTITVHWGIKKGRFKKNPPYPNQEKKFSKMNSEPWILVTNLDQEQQINAEQAHKLAIFTKDIYSKRMQIEQNFRDDKSERFGFGWRFSGTKNREKVSVLALLATITSFILWMIGFAAEKRKLQYSFQANTIRSRRVLSFIYLAKQLIINGLKKIKFRKFHKIIALFQLEYNEKFRLELIATGVQTK